LVLAIGPAYLLCASWPSTEKYAEIWIGQILNFALLKVLIGVCFFMLMDFASKFAAHIGAHVDAVNAIKATTALLSCVGSLAIVMLSLPQRASALAGGASISGIGRTIGRALIDLLNRPGKSSKPPRGGGSIDQGIGPRGDRGQTAGASAPPLRPLFQRNAIERLRTAK
jgi:type IV secretion system protein VirB6